MDRPSFDIATFHAALDAQRIARGLSWRQVAEQAQVSPATLTRIVQGNHPNLDTSHCSSTDRV